MKKKLLVLAVAGALAAPFAAMADTTIYGAANVSLDMTNNGNSDVTAPGNGAQGTSATQVSSNASRIGFKGSEDLGGGTSAVWQIEQQVNIDSGGVAGNGLATRNTFAGLSGESWGTLILGQHDTPYKLAARGLDLFADTIADNRSLMGQTGGGAASHDQRLGNVVAYISPAMSGFTAAVAYVAGAENAVASAQTKASAWSLAGMYNQGPINAALAYQVVDGGTANNVGGTPTLNVLSSGDKATAWRLSGGYTMDQFTVNAAYERTTSSGNGTGVLPAGGDALAQNNWYLAGKYNVSASDAVKLAYTSAGKNPQAAGIVNVVNSDANQLSVGYDHAMSKRTTVYALYTKLSNKNAAMYTLVNGDATTGGNAIPGAGADPSAWSLGMKHTF